jgi:hypothetical protein
MRRFVRLSKIAHIWKFVGTCDVASMPNTHYSMCGSFNLQYRIRSFWHGSAGYVEFPPTVEAHPVGAPFNSEHAAQMAVPASTNKLEEVRKHAHKSCARWRRSQHPLESSHSSRERMLARARAMAQSAAP